MNKKVVLELPEEENKSLVLAATGSPYLLIVEEQGVGVHRIVKPGFDCDLIFNFIKELAEEQPGFRKVLVDYIIELSEIL